MSRSAQRPQAIARAGVAFLWMYQGLIPKLLFRDAGELALIEQGPQLLSPEWTLGLAGGAECGLALAVLIWWNRSWPLWVSLVAFAGLMCGALVLDPGLATHAFNPVTLSVSGMLFCRIGLQHCKATSNSA